MVEARSDLTERIATALDEEPVRPWCKHRLYEEILRSSVEGSRDEGLDAAERAADELVYRGDARREYVSAVAIGVHCEDSVYWSKRSVNERLADFGREYEAPTVLHRLASHIQCHGL